MLILGLLGSLVVVALAVILAGSRGLTSRLWPAPESSSLNFSSLERTGKPNDYLVCPESACGTTPDRISPVFPIPMENLKQHWTELINSESRVVRILGGPEADQQQFVQRTPWLGFPDIVTVRFYSLPQSQSTLAVYSRSNYGYSDLGANSRRVRKWLERLALHQD